MKVILEENFNAKIRNRHLYFMKKLYEALASVESLKEFRLKSGVQKAAK